MRSYRKTIALTLIAAFALAACATGKPTIQSSGELLHELSEQYIATAHLYANLRAKNLLTPEEWNRWVAFAQPFNQSLQSAGLTWFAVRSTNDAAGAAELQTTLLNLKNELLVYALEAVAKSKQEPKP